MTDFEDHYPPERIAVIKQSNSRTEIAAFMHSFRYMVMKQEDIPPPHWIFFAAELLGAAADAADEKDGKRRERKVTQVLGLTGREDFSSRDRVIAMAIHRLAKNNRSNREAASMLSGFMEEYGVTVSEDTLLSIYNRSDRGCLNDVNASGLDVIDPPVMKIITSYYSRS